MVGARRSLIELGHELPVNLEGGAIFHAGPIARQKEDGEYEMVTIGPTEKNKKVFDDKKKPILVRSNQQVRFIE